MLLVIIGLLTFPLVFIEFPIGLVIYGVIFISIVMAATSYYTESLKAYWNYRDIEQTFHVLKMRRYTILKQMLEAIDEWKTYERDIIKDASATSITSSFLVQRYPTLQSMYMGCNWIGELRDIESRINSSLLNRVRYAAKYWYFKDNILYGYFCAIRIDVPKDLVGEVYDPKLPGDGSGKW